MILLIGLAVGVDYSLFYLRREREERAAGGSDEASLQAAASTSGRAVLVSGLHGDHRDGRHVRRPATPTFISFATGTIIVVAIAVLGSLTVLPGGAVEARRPRRVGPRPVHAPAARGRDGESRRLGAPSSIACSAPARLARSGRAACWSCWRSRPSACTRSTPACTVSRATSRSCRPTTASRRPSRASRSGDRGCQCAQRRERPMKTAIARLDIRRGRHRRVLRAGHHDASTRTDGRRGVDPDRGATAPTTTRSPRSRRCATTSSRSPSARCRPRRARHRDDRAVGATSTIC